MLRFKVRPAAVTGTVVDGAKGGLLQEVIGLALDVALPATRWDD